MFKDYIIKTLGFFPLLKKGPLRALVAGASKSLDFAEKDIVFLRDKIMPETADSESIKKIAGSRGIRRWPVENDEDFKIRVIMAYAFWKKGENPLGMKEIIKAFGYEHPEILEHNNDQDKAPDQYSTFSVSLGLNASVSETGFLLKLINEVKPARSKLRQIKARSLTEILLKPAGPAVKNGVLNKILPYFDYRAKIFAAAETKTKNTVFSELKPLNPESRIEQRLVPVFCKRETIKTLTKTNLIKARTRSEIRTGIKLKTTISV